MDQTRMINVSPARGGAMLTLHQQTLSLLPERAVFWHQRQLLIVADVHLGKAQTFQRAGLAVPGQSFEHDLQRLRELVTKTGAQQLLILGDFVHHASGLTPAVRQRIQDWCHTLPAKIALVAGNHDKPSLPFLATLPINIVSHNHQFPFDFAHDLTASRQGEFIFVGHVHPVIKLRAGSTRFPAFAFYNNHCIVPAFSYFTGGWPVDRNGLQQVFVAVEEEGVVLELPNG